MFLHPNRGNVIVSNLGVRTVLTAFPDKSDDGWCVWPWGQSAFRIRPSNMYTPVLTVKLYNILISLQPEPSSYNLVDFVDTKIKEWPLTAYPHSSSFFTPPASVHSVFISISKCVIMQLFVLYFKMNEVDTYDYEPKDHSKSFPSDPPSCKGLVNQFSWCLGQIYAYTCCSRWPKIFIRGEKQGRKRGHGKGERRLKWLEVTQ